MSLGVSCLISTSIAATMKGGDSQESGLVDQASASPRLWVGDTDIACRPFLYFIMRQHILNQ